MPQGRKEWRVDSISQQGRTASERLSHGVRVTVRPRYLPDHSDPDLSHYVFAYHVRIANESPRTVMLLHRHWIIIDTDGHSEEVKGAGVVGEQPVLEPGEAFEYTSFCPMPSAFGTMEGSVHLLDEGGVDLDVEVGRFYLVADVLEDAQEDARGV